MVENMDTSYEKLYEDEKEALVRQQLEKEINELFI